MSEPERIGKLTGEAMEILKRRCEWAKTQKPPAYDCELCEDYGLVWVRVKGPDYEYWDTYRCHCDGKQMGWYVPAEERTKTDGSKKRVFGPRTWDVSIPRYRERGFERGQVFGKTLREEWDTREWLHAAAMLDVDAVEERKAIQEESDA